MATRKIKTKGAMRRGTSAKLKSELGKSKARVSSATKKATTSSARPVPMPIFRPPTGTSGKPKLTWPNRTNTTSAANNPSNRKKSTGTTSGQLRLHGKTQAAAMKAKNKAKKKGKRRGY